MPVVNDMLKIWHKGNAMDGARALRTRLGMPSGPDALHVGSFFRWPRTVAVVVMTDVKQAEGSEGVRIGGIESNGSSGRVTEANWAFNAVALAKGSAACWVPVVSDGISRDTFRILACLTNWWSDGRCLLCKVVCTERIYKLCTLFASGFSLYFAAVGILHCFVVLGTS